jgi:hypothetical protein
MSSVTANDPSKAKYEVSGDTTEWDDILIKKGILTEEDVLLGKGLDPTKFMDKYKEPEAEAQPEPTVFDKLEGASLGEIDEIEDDLDDDSILAKFRESRIQQMKEEKLKNRWGSVIEISRVDWVKEVTECSKDCWVCVHLYEDSIPHCTLVDEAMKILCAKFPAVKFINIRSQQAVENWPEKNLPTLFCYNKGDLQVQLLTLNSVGGDSCREENLEWWMAEKGIVTTELEGNPNSPRKTVNRIVGKHTTHNSSIYSDDEDDDV